MTELFNDEVNDEDKILVEDETIELIVVETKPRSAADARRRLEDLFEEKRLQAELNDVF